MKQIKERVLFIAILLYPRYSLLFLFDNITSHLVYSTNAFEVKNINKRFNSKHVFLRDSWYF